MAGRDPRSPDPDDWFAGPDRAQSRRARQPERAPGAGTDEDDWIADDPRRRRSRPALAASLPDRWVPMAAGAVLVVVFLVAVLAFAGVFSSSTPTPTPPITPVDTNPVTTPTTTQAAAPVVPVPTAPLKPGDTGVQVKRLQRALAHLGYTIGTVDGDYGTTTKTAVEQFQTASNLTADGLFGPATRTALSAALKASG
jgi:hypothetical protein